MMVSQGRDGYPGAGPSKGLLGPEAKAKARTYHYLQVRLWWGWGTGASVLTSVTLGAVEGVGWEPAPPMMTGLQAAGSSLPHCLGDFSFPICAVKGPFYFDVCQCQEDFSSTCCLGQAVPASLL